jgi:hypothetical protein
VSIPHASRKLTAYVCNFCWLIYATSVGPSFQQLEQISNTRPILCHMSEILGPIVSLEKECGLNVIKELLLIRAVTEPLAQGHISSVLLCPSYYPVQFFV